MFLRKLGQSRMASALRYHPPVSHLVGVRLACRVQAEHETVSAPKLNAIAPRQLLCPHDSMIIGSAHERSAISDVSIFPDEVCGRQMRKFGIKYSRLHPQPLAVRDAFIAVRRNADWEAVLDRWYADDLPGRHPTPDDVDEAECDAQGSLIRQRA